MSIAKKWSHYLKQNITRLSNNYGVYEIADGNGFVVYIGEGHVRDRLLAHLIGPYERTPGASYYRYELTGGKLRAHQRQNAFLSEFQKRYGKLPRYNQKRRG